MPDTIHTNTGTVRTVRITAPTTGTATTMAGALRGISDGPEDGTVTGMIPGTTLTGDFRIHITGALHIIGGLPTGMVADIILTGPPVSRRAHAGHPASILRPMATAVRATLTAVPAAVRDMVPQRDIAAHPAIIRPAVHPAAVIPA